MNTIAIVGGTGHTGSFVVAELVRRSHRPCLVGRNQDSLDALSRQHGVPNRVSTLAPPDLAGALSDVQVVVNCAGPFSRTAAAVARASLEAGAHYLDVSAEQESLIRAHDLHALAEKAHVALVPGMAFFGGLADLVATSIVDPSRRIERIEVAVALNRWWPTSGTRRTGRHNTYPRRVLRDGRLTPLASRAGIIWDFGPPLGAAEVVPAPMSEVVAIARHLEVATMNSYLSSNAIADLNEPSTRPPVAIDSAGRSAQTFILDMRLTQDGSSRRRLVTGGDIYAVTAPLVAEAVGYLLSPSFVGSGAMAPAEAFPAQELLYSLADAGEISVVRPPVPASTERSRNEEQHTGPCRSAPGDGR